MEYLGNMGLEPDEGFLQEALQQLTQTVVELEAAKQIGAGRLTVEPEEVCLDLEPRLVPF